MFPVAARRGRNGKANAGIWFLLTVTILICLNYCLTLTFSFRYDTFTWLDKTMFDRLDYRFFFAANKASPYFAPIGNLLFLAMYRLFGIKPFGYHLCMLTIHTVNAYLVYWLAARLLHSKVQAFLASLLFGVFPAHIDGVVYVATIHHTLATSFALLSLISFARFLQTRRGRYYSLLLVLLVLGLLTKQVAVVIPFLCAGYEHVALGRHVSWSSLKKYMPILAISVAYLLVNGAVGRANTAYAPIHAQVYRVGPHILANSIEYIGYMAFPFDRIVGFLEGHVSQGVGDLLSFVRALMLAAFIALVAYYAARLREVRFSLLWVLAALLPILPFLFPPQSRYTYLPSVGFCIMLAIILSRIASGTKFYRAAAIAILVVYSVANLSNMYSLAGDYDLWRSWTSEVKSHFPSLPADSKLYLVGFPQLAISRDDEISSAIRVVLTNPTLEVHAVSIDEYSRVENDATSYTLRYENGHFQK